MVRVIKTFIFSLLLLGLFQESFAEQDMLAGGDTKKKYVIGTNFIGGTYGFQVEIEKDIRINQSQSVAPRIGGTGLVGIPTDYLSVNFLGTSGIGELYPSFFMGFSYRFSIVDGVRPHGFWVGPSFDLALGTYRKSSSSGVERKFVAVFVPSGEFGWRYTLSFGLSFQILIRLGFHIDSNLIFGFYAASGVGLGFAF